MTKDAEIEVSMDAIPREESVVLQSSSFFQNKPKGTSLPSPKEVRSAHQDFMHGHEELHPQAPHIVRYPSLGLCVKYSQRVRLNEAQAMYLVNHHLGKSFVAPEIYGWHKDGADIFLYMELIEGEPLDEVWHSLPAADRQEVCKELCAAMSKLGTLRQAKGHTFLGNLTRGSIPDRLFANIQPSAGPFETVTAFHDWLTGLKGGGWDEFRGPGMLSDDYNIRLAHGDLHRSNIIIQRDSNHKWKLSGIVDWEMCSWMPEYWDYCRARWPLSPSENATFGEVYLPYIFSERSADYSNLYLYWNFFIERLGKDG
ncbi:hypothetical protein VM1G_07946 [Cytospora mali]|uniref:Aminoglycoside phosphotransferase domain-containing protein n=1 Tax=Cytospora mali TaxID=578113 RepID=A0A194W737_CYTMA|nr:hypothetical protein VM1G_07946 [Valsa mali]